MTTFFRRFAGRGVFLLAVLLASNQVLAQAVAKPGASGAAVAAKAVEVELVLKRIDKGEAGKEVLVSVDSVKPGDLVEYRAIYRNQSKKAVANLAATLPVPVGLTYVERSARPMRVTASTGGQRFEVEPLMRKVVGKDGKERQEMVAYEEYRSLRWKVDALAAGKQVEVSARMRVNSGSTAPVVAVSAPTK